MYTLAVKMKDAIREKLSYPEEANFSFGESPSFVNGVVSDADSGKVVIAGNVIGKNGFGVKIRFFYMVETTVLPDVLNVDNISVFEK